MFVQQANQCLSDINIRKIIHKAPFTGALFDLFLPNQCLICSQTICSERILCDTCIDVLEKNKPSGTYKTTPSLEKIYFYDYYDSPLTELIKSYKYGPHKSLERFLAYFLSLLLDFWKLPKTIVPIPSHVVSIRSRGFSSVENIVKSCKEVFCSELNALSVIKRKGEYIPQASLSDPEKRKENATKSYSISDGKIPSEILIFDDIMTSGNTLESVAKLIKQRKSDCKITGVVFVKRGR